MSLVLFVCLSVLLKFKDNFISFRVRKGADPADPPDQSACKEKKHYHCRWNFLRAPFTGHNQQLHRDLKNSTSHNLPR